MAIAWHRLHEHVDVEACETRELFPDDIALQAPLGRQQDVLEVAAPAAPRPGPGAGRRDPLGRTLQDLDGVAARVSVARAPLGDQDADPLARQGVADEHHAALVARGLNDSHFDAVVEHLAGTLAELGVGEADIFAVAQIAESVRDDVVHRPLRAGGHRHALLLGAQAVDEGADARPHGAVRRRGAAGDEDPATERWAHSRDGFGERERAVLRRAEHRVHARAEDEVHADEAAAREVQNLFASRSLRIYRSTDVAGVELSGAVKNVIAIACGITMGRRLGENARAALITRGLAEMMRLGAAKGAKIATMMGLSGLGDLTLTCNSAQSRNLSLGLALGKGDKLADVLARGVSVSEGVFSAEAVRGLAERHGVEMPICLAVDAVLNHGGDIDATIESLLDRPAGEEMYGIGSEALDRMRTLR